jgi:glycosyltransferase involved in cell wall biosynthesis
LREQLGIAPDALVFMSASRLHEQKGVDKNIELFAQVKKIKPDAKLLICGNGPWARCGRRLTSLH